MRELVGAWGETGVERHFDPLFLLHRTGVFYPNRWGIAKRKYSG